MKLKLKWMVCTSSCWFLGSMQKARYISSLNRIAVVQWVYFDWNLRRRRVITMAAYISTRRACTDAHEEWREPADLSSLEEVQALEVFGKRKGVWRKWKRVRASFIGHKWWTPYTLLRNTSFGIGFRLPRMQFISKQWRTFPPTLCAYPGHSRCAKPSCFSTVARVMRGTWDQTARLPGSLFARQIVLISRANTSPLFARQSTKFAYTR